MAYSTLPSCANVTRRQEIIVRMKRSVRATGNNLYNIGALDGGPPMSPVDFKKWQCPLSLF